MKSLALSLLLVASSLSAAEDRHTVRLLELPPVGATTHTRESMDFRSSLRVVNPDGTLAGTKRSHESEVTMYSETRKDASHLTRSYETATRESEEGVQKKAYDHQTVRFTISPAGKVTASGSFDPAEVKELAQTLEHGLAMDKANLCIPKTPLAVGDSWKVSPGDADLCFNFFPSGGAGSSTGKLVAIDERAGKKIARIEFTSHLLVKNLGELAFDSPAQLDQNVIIETPADVATPNGSFHFTGTLTGLSHPGGPSKPSMELRFEITGEGSTE